jgi:hypothetical protein
MYRRPYRGIVGAPVQSVHMYRVQSDRVQTVQGTASCTGTRSSRSSGRQYMYLDTLTVEVYCRKGTYEFSTTVVVVQLWFYVSTAQHFNRKSRVGILRGFAQSVEKA